MTFTMIGMPGCGKSCMGRYLSGKLKMKFIDGDRLIEQKTEKKLHELISELGLEGFKQLEEDTLLSINEDNAIIAPGGSAVYYDSVMQHFKNIGKVIYIYVGLPEITERLGDFSKRGVVLRENQTLEDLYRERTELYKKYADITVNCNGKAYSKYHAKMLTAIEKFL